MLLQHQHQVESPALVALPAACPSLALPPCVMCSVHVWLRAQQTYKDKGPALPGSRLPLPDRCCRPPVVTALGRSKAAEPRGAMAGVNRLDWRAAAAAEGGAAPARALPAAGLGLPAAAGAGVAAGRAVLRAVRRPSGLGLAKGGGLGVVVVVASAALRAERPPRAPAGVASGAAGLRAVPPPPTAAPSGAAPELRSGAGVCWAARGLPPPPLPTAGLALAAPAAAPAVGAGAPAGLVLLRPLPPCLLASRTLLSRPTPLVGCCFPCCWLSGCSPPCSACCAAGPLAALSLLPRPPLRGCMICCSSRQSMSSLHSAHSRAQMSSPVP